MKSVLNWKRGAFSSTLRIFSGEETIGELTTKTLKQSAHGIIHKRRYLFRTKGLFKQETQILDGLSHQVLGHINYNAWMTKATIRFTDRTIFWKYDNRWQTRWSLYDDQGTLVKFAGGSSKGTIECEKEDDILVITGMFVTNYYQRAMIAVVVAVFIPIWYSAMN